MWVFVASHVTPLQPPVQGSVDRFHCTDVQPGPFVDVYRSISDDNSTGLSDPRAKGRPHRARSRRLSEYTIRVLKCSSVTRPANEEESNEEYFRYYPSFKDSRLSATDVA